MTKDVGTYTLWLTNAEVEASFAENHYHLGHKFRCTLPLIQDICQVLQTQRTIISKTANAITHLLSYNCITGKTKLTVNVKISRNIVIL